MNLRDLGLNMGYTGTRIAQNYDCSIFFFDLTPCWPIFCQSPHVSEFLRGPPAAIPLSAQAAMVEVARIQILPGKIQITV